MSETDLDPFAVLEAIGPTAHHGKSDVVVGRICFAMMFFIPPDGSLATAPRTVEAEARVAQSLGREAYDHWLAEDDAQSLTGAFRSEAPPDPGKTLEAFMAENDSHHGGVFSATYWAGDRKGKAPPTRMISWFFDRRMERDSHSEADWSHSFQVNIPLQVLSTRAEPSLLQKLFGDLCQILQPLSAVGGLCMATPLDPILLQAQQEQEALYPLLLDHPGLLFGSALDMVQHTRKKMSAVNWLTAVRAELVDECGGLDVLGTLLDHPGIATAPYGDKGLLIQAGPAPQLGNRSEQLQLLHYGLVAKALRPARIALGAGSAPHVNHFGPEDALFDDDLMVESQNAWLCRFDDMA